MVFHWTQATPAKLYSASNLCRNCHRNPIMAEPDMKEKSVHHYYKEKDYDRKKMTKTVSFPTKKNELGLCYYCKKVFLRLVTADSPTQFNVQLRKQLEMKRVLRVVK